MKKILTKAQAFMISKTIEWGIKDSKFRNEYFSQRQQDELFACANRFASNQYTEDDIEIAKWFRFMPYTHSDNDRELALQLLAWHKIGALDMEVDIRRTWYYAEKINEILELIIKDSEEEEEE